LTEPSTTIIYDNARRTCISIDNAKIGQSKVIKKEAENILKYKEPTIEHSAYDI